MGLDNNYDYISLQKATKFCNYSQEYLSLRARQGKLKALKLGRNWVTKKEWLKEYLAKIEEYDHYINNKKAEKKIVKEKIIKHLPPQNLPIETFFRGKGLRWQNLRSAFITALVFVLIMAGGIFGKEGLTKTYNDFFHHVDEINQAQDLIVEDIVQGVLEASQKIESFSDDIYLANTLRFVSNVFEEYGQWVKNQILGI